MPPAPRTRVFLALTGLRGVSVASVALIHFGGAVLALLPAAAPLLTLTVQIAFRLDIFFILTGFILAYIYIGRQEQFSFSAHRAFLWARLIRMYPGHLAMFLVLFVGVVGGRLLHIPIEGRYSMSAIAPQLALIHVWPFFTWAEWDWNYPSWFLSAVWFAYVFIFPFVWMLTPKLRRSKWPLVWLLGPLLILLPLRVINAAPQLRPVLRASGDIFSGIVLFILYANDSRILRAAQRHVDKLVLVGFLGLVAALVHGTGSAWVLINSVCFLACPLLIAGLTAETSVTARLLMLRPVLWLGELSYALFISHAIALKLLKVILPGQRFSNSPLALRLLILASYVVVVLGLAVAVNRLVELPCWAALKRKSKNPGPTYAKQLVPVPLRNP